jgi:8-oxo-dGTP pyrophosphatase MutT (NUDIX family)
VSEHVQRIRRIVGHDVLLQIPSVSIALRDSEGRVLLARHSERLEWLLPGGAIEPGEVPAAAAVREMFEETGLHGSEALQELPAAEVDTCRLPESNRCC